MAQLTEKDLATVLELSLEAQACSGVDEFGSEFVPELRRLVPCDLLGYNEVDLARATARFFTGFARARSRGIRTAHDERHP